jgi:hypothetical protein
MPEQFCAVVPIGDERKKKSYAVPENKSILMRHSGAETSKVSDKDLVAQQ